MNPTPIPQRPTRPIRASTRRRQRAAVAQMLEQPDAERGKAEFELVERSAVRRWKAAI